MGNFKKLTARTIKIQGSSNKLKTSQTEEAAQKWKTTTSFSSWIISKDKSAHSELSKGISPELADLMHEITYKLLGPFLTQSEGKLSCFIQTH